MGIDGKYGHVEFPDHDWVTIGEDEPVIVFRAQDNHATEVIKFYRKLCVSSEAPQHHLDLIDRTLKTFKDWKQDNTVKDPDSNTWLKAQTVSEDILE